MSIRTRLTIALGLMIMALAAVSVGSIYVFESTDRHLRALNDEAVEETVLRERVYRLLARADERATDIVNAGRTSDSAFDQIAAELTRRLDDTETFDEEEEAELAMRAERSWRRAAMTARGIFVAGPEQRAALGRFRREVSATYDALADLGRSTTEEAVEDIAALERRQHRAAALVLVVTFAAAALAVIAAIRFQRFLSRRVTQLERAADRVGMDDLGVRLEETDDELGRVARSFNAMTENISTTRAQLAHHAFHDSLTGLANRALFLDRVAHALDRRRRHPQLLAVVFLDLDDFKSVNDGLGHSAGDDMLVGAARRLELNLRPADTLTRLGGDEFAVLLEDVEDEHDAARITQRLLDALAVPAGLGDGEYVITASAGIALSTGEEDADELLRNADLAMYSAKRAGRGGYAMFEQQMHASALERLEYEAELRRAVANEEFSLRFQPVIDLADGSVVAVESLVRWRHPERGEVAPGEFIPIAERTGLIVPLGRWILREALAAGVRLQSEWDGGKPLGVGVNLSLRQLTDSDIVTDVAQALGESGIDPKIVTLEITESVLADDVDLVVDRLERLRGLGVRLALDDFAPATRPSATCSGSRSTC